MKHRCKRGHLRSSKNRNSEGRCKLCIRMRRKSTPASRLYAQQYRHSPEALANRKIWLSSPAGKASLLKAKQWNVLRRAARTEKRILRKLRAARDAAQRAERMLQARRAVDQYWNSLIVQAPTRDIKTLRRMLKPEFAPEW